MYRPYNRNVLIGNWYEDRVLEEDVIKDYLEKRNRGELSSQRQANINSELNIRIGLTTVNDGRVHVGDVITLKCDGTQDQQASLIAKAYRKDCYLSINGLACSGTSAPIINSTTALVIRSVDGSAPGTPISFGQPFAITNYDGSLFLHSDTRSYDKAAKSSRLQVVDFVTVYNHECDWVATCLNPKFRLEAEGTDIPANEKVVILHMKTNKALGVVTDYNNPSKFEIVANTFLNSHKAEEDVNHFKFVTNLPQVPVPQRLDD